MHHALGEGMHQDVLDLHERVPYAQKLDSVGELLEPHRRHLESGARAYDVHADMPPIQHLQIPNHMQPKNCNMFINCKKK